MRDANQVTIYGASGYAYAMSLTLRHGFSPHALGEVIAFIEDGAGGEKRDLQGTPILSFEEWYDTHAAVPCVVSVGSPRSRARIVERLTRAGAIFENVYGRLPPTLFPGVRIGVGAFIGPSTYIGPLTTIGDHAQIMSVCSIGHDVRVGDFCTICPSCTVSGYVDLEEGVFLGAGTTIVNGKLGAPLRIGRGAKISAGSVVTKSVPDGAKLAGNPARPLREIVQYRRFADVA